MLWYTGIAKMMVRSCYWDIIVEHSGLNNKDWELHMRLYMYIARVRAILT